MTKSTRKSFKVAFVDEKPTIVPVIERFEISVPEKSEIDKAMEETMRRLRESFSGVMSAGGRMERLDE